jgi:outer membrane murein-binding lipoprotein Lpp
MVFKNSVNKFKKITAETATVVSTSVKQGSKKLVGKSTDLVETSKLSLKASSLESEIDALYSSIGKITYENYKYGAAIDNSVADSCSKIDEIKSSIEELRIKIDSLKNQKK